MKQKFNVLLINPYIGFKIGDFYRPLSEPLGLLYIASYMTQKSDKYNIKILDLYALNPVKHKREGFDDKFYFGLTERNKITELVQNYSPDIIGISSQFTGYAEYSVETAKTVKESMPSVPVVIGGAHATFFAENILNKYNFVDFIIRGEGEISFFELCEAIRTKSEITNISGITYRAQDNHIISNKNREPVENLDEFKIPERTLIDMNKYFDMSSDVFPGSCGYPVATMVLSRGCKFNCIFCSTKNMWANKWRSRSHDSIINEIEYLIRNFNVKEIAFVVDQILGDKKWFEKLLDIIILKKFKLTFQAINGLSVWLIDKNLLLKMKNAGFYKIALPIDTGNPNTLKYINKQQINLTEVKKTIELVHTFGFFSSANFLIGFPFETEEEINKTVKFAYTCGVDIIYFFIAKMHAGSDMYDKCTDIKLLENIETSGSWANVTNSSLTISSEKLSAILSKAQKHYFIYKCIFLLNPVNFYKHIFFKMIRIKNYILVFKFLKFKIKNIRRNIKYQTKK